ncbi:hypothetical protein UlMin_017292 [Ulmus minor]
MSEIPHPLYRRGSYDEAAILMSGRNAKTNFPHQNATSDHNSNLSKPTSAILSAKLRNCCKSPSPSLTCLRLDTEHSHIGVWQKRAGAPRSNSNWVMMMELGKNNLQVLPGDQHQSAKITAMARPQGGSGLDEEEKVALQMIEELLNCN